jgi:hypothetical protein
MTPDDTKNQIRILLDMRAELNRYGGAEEAPLIWHDYVTQRSFLFKQFGLPETSVNFKLLDPLPITDVEKRWRNLSRLSDDQRFGEYFQLKDILGQAGIIGFTEDQVYDHKNESIVNLIFERLYLRAKNLHKLPRPTPRAILKFGKEEKVAANDLLILLGYTNEPYQRFLIHTIWYGGFCTANQVMIELKLAQDLMNVWAFVEYSSDFIWEKQMGVENLKRSGLRFVNWYLWWEQDINFYGSIEPMGKDAFQA